MQLFEKVIFVRLMNINFVKRNLFQTYIEQKACDGLKENGEKWLIIAKNIGVFKRKEQVKIE